MKKFCRDNPAERLGYQKDGIQDIKKNRWFQVHNISNTFTAGSSYTHIECRYRWFPGTHIYNTVTAGSRYTNIFTCHKWFQAQKCRHLLPLVPGTQKSWTVICNRCQFQIHKFLQLNVTACCKFKITNIFYNLLLVSGTHIFPKIAYRFHFWSQLHKYL